MTSGDKRVPVNHVAAYLPINAELLRDLYPNTGIADLLRKALRGELEPEPWPERIAWNGWLLPRITRWQTGGRALRERWQAGMRGFRYGWPEREDEWE